MSDGEENLSMEVGENWNEEGDNCDPCRAWDIVGDEKGERCLRIYQLTVEDLRLEVDVGVYLPRLWKYFLK